MRLLNSLQTKLTASFVALILVVTSLTFLYTYRETRTALKEITQTELMAVAAVVAADLSGPDADAMAALRPGDEDSATFLRLRDRLRGLRAAHPDLKYIYTMRRAGSEVVFMVDADYGAADDPGAAVGEPYEDAKGRMVDGFERPAADDEFTTDRWGTFLSGYAPLRGVGGSVVGLVGVDMASDLVLEKQAFIGRTIYLIMAVGVLVAGLFILLFSQTIIKDIHKLNRAATQISMGDMDAQVDVVRRDEIGELADSFGRMAASLKIMMMARREP